MNLSDYQKLASRTMDPNDNELTNYAMGLAGETGEVVDYLKKVIFHGHTLDHKEITKELGDTLWYVSAIATYLNIDLDEVAIQNIEKLRQRYPNGFDENRSINRSESR